MKKLKPNIKINEKIIKFYITEIEEHEFHQCSSILYVVFQNSSI